MNDPIKNRFKHMTPEKKLKLASMLYWSAYELKKSALRTFYPELTDDEIEQKTKDFFTYAKS